MIQFEQNIPRILERTRRAAAAVGRSPDDITLLAVTKTVPAEIIARAIDAGLRHFGENRVQEAESKIPLVPATAALEWHLIGHLQTNKARKAAELFRVVHSVDSLRLARKISEAALHLNRPLSVFIQVDLAGEATKYGVRPDLVCELVEAVRSLQGIRLNGLMTIPPFHEDPEQTRPFFARLRSLRDRLETECPGCLGQGHLSMGMSHDFEVAVAEGATILRIGTAIFGERPHAA